MAESAQFYTGFLLGAAEHFRRMSEGQPATKFTRAQEGSYAIGAIVMSAAFVEGAVNELFAAAKMPFGSLLGRESKPFATRLREAAPRVLAKTGVREYLKKAKIPNGPTILRKYDLAYRLKFENLMDRGTRAWAHADKLIRARDYFMHAQPEFLPVRSREGGFMVEEGQLGAILDGTVDVPESLRNDGAHPFAMYVRAPLATWALESATTFASSFFEAMETDLFVQRYLRNSRLVIPGRSPASPS